MKKNYGSILFLILLLTISKNSFSQLLINENFNSLTTGSKSPLSSWAYSRGYFPVIDETYSSSGWQADDFGNVVGGSNLIAARGNIYGSARNFWLITPAFDLNNTSIKTLSFDAALTTFGTTSQGSFDSNDDSLIIAYSLNGGTTWSYSQVLKVYTAGDTVPSAGKNEIIDLSS
ncbi:MAG: hypothetical protein ABI550_02260, partial [Ignavibacteriaceae bacterium]